MKYLDFISSPPSLYLLNQSKAKSKVGGFFSLLFILTMIGISIYYLFSYFNGDTYNIKYYHDNIFSLSDEDKNLLNNSIIETFFFINENYDNCKIHLILSDDGKYDDETTIPKCNDKFNIDTTKENCYYLNFTLFKSKTLYLVSEGECTDLDGESRQIENKIRYKLLSINHKKDNPLDDSFSVNTSLLLSSSKNSITYETLEFTPVIYKTTKKLRVFNDKKETILGKFMSNQKYLTQINRKSKDINVFFALIFQPTSLVDIYEREYTKFIDILSKVGGLFSPIKIFFSVLIMFYSSYENNYQIVKSIILKKQIYENYEKKNIKVDEEIKLKEKKNLLNKKNKLNSCVHFIGSFFKCCPKRKTMKILNLCDEFVKEYLSADNIIFNSILFESYYKDNPIINIKENVKLKQIEKELYMNIDESELLSSYNNINDNDSDNS